MIPVIRQPMRGGGPPAEVDIHVDSDYERDVFERHVKASE
jgi:hypothetical protein